MKVKSSTRLISSERCHYFTPGGRQCASLVTDRSSGLCTRHASQNQAASVDSANFREALTCEAAAFQNAQGVNHSLGALYNLLSEGRISPRRASVLAYISSLLLRTLPAIDYDLDRFPEPKAAETPAVEPPAPTAPSVATRRLIAGGKEPLPKSPEEFADAVLNRKLN